MNDLELDIQTIKDTTAKLIYKKVIQNTCKRSKVLKANRSM